MDFASSSRTVDLLPRYPDREIADAVTVEVACSQGRTEPVVLFRYAKDIASLGERNALLYFDASNFYGSSKLLDGTTASDVLPYNPAGSALGFRPYRNESENDNDMANPPDPHYNRDTFQIISAGLDKRLGQGTGFGNGEDQSWNTLDCDEMTDPDQRCEWDADNITNFTKGKTLAEFLDL